MRRVYAGVIILCMSLILPSFLFAQDNQPPPNLPPIGQQLIREGDFAIKLADALELGTVADEVEAETLLGKAGITPRNGWIADYPVTPDIMGELYKSVRDAAASRKIPIETNEALNRLKAVSVGQDMAVTPAANSQGSAQVPNTQVMPDQAAIDDYYSTEGPPVVTYYQPPPDYYYLYSWVPYPFWWFGFSFPGYFMLNDFYRVGHLNGRMFFISNHFRDIRNHRVFRIDPVRRFNGRTYGGIGANHSRGFISTGVRGGNRTIFNNQRMRMSPGFSSQGSSHRSSGSFSGTRGGGGSRSGFSGSGGGFGGSRGGGAGGGSRGGGGVRR